MLDRRSAAPDRRQPDLGTAVTLLPVFLGIAFLAGLRMRLLAVARDGRRARSRRSPGSSRSRTTRANASRPSSIPSGSARRRLPADSGAGHRRLRRADRQGVPERHAGAVQVPARRPQRLHLLGAGGRAGVHRRARRAGAVSVRDFAQPRGGAAGEGSPGRVSGGGNRFRFRVSGDLQHHDVGRAGAGQGHDAAAHELRRIVRDRHPGRFRPHPQRAGCGGLQIEAASDDCVFDAASDSAPEFSE